jgi:uncharacterized protein YndB with AHSA1/START domain
MIMRKIIVSILALLALGIGSVLAYAAVQPDTFTFARTVTIAAPPEKIMPLIQDLKAFNQWNPFAQGHPAATIAYSGPQSGKGATYEWKGDSAGQGRVEVTEVEPSSHVTMQLDMMRPMEAHNLVNFTLKPNGNATDVTWSMSGRSPFIARVVCVFYNMTGMVEAEFDKGLASLKSLAEKG